MRFLKDHPFAVEAFFKSSVVLTFAVAVEELLSLVPAPLVPDTFENKYGFISVAMVQTSGLRPKGLPEFVGNDFFLIGYRVFVRYTTIEGKRLRGLYILKSETDQKKMEVMGNMFTHYNYTTTDIEQSETLDQRIIQSRHSGFRLSISKSDGEITLPAGSPFHDWKEARRFAGPLPFTFTVNPEERSILIIEGVRQNWKPEPISILEYDFSFLKTLNVSQAILANAFEVKNIPYYWKKGHKEKWM